MENSFRLSLLSVRPSDGQRVNLRSASGFDARRLPIRRRFYAWTLFIALSGPISGVEAAPQPKNVGPTTGAKRVSRGESYILGAGDALRVVVTGYPEFSQESIGIPPDGTVTLPNFGDLRLSGKTRLGVQREFAAILKRKFGMRNPAVAVSIVGFRSETIGRVVLSGDGSRSGTFGIRVGYRLSDLLADVGLQSRLEERQASLIRRGGILTLNLKSAVESPRGPSDIVLQPGDSITVKQIKLGQITLSGDLPRLGVYELHPIPLREAMELGLQPRLSDLITKAGGLRLDNPAILENLGLTAATTVPGQSKAEAAAALSRAMLQVSYKTILQRGGKRQSLDAEAALARIDGPANVRLQAGDFVTIEAVPPPQPITVYIDALTARTGSFQVPPETGIYELITTAGGVTRPPGEIIASVRRGTQTLPLDLPALLLSSQSGANLTLKNGDIVQLREPESIEIQMAGRIGKPGPLRLKPGSTIFDAVLASGGLSVTAEDARLNVLRKEADGSQRVLTANAAGIMGLTDVSTNFTLQNRDLINITQNATQTVTISGQVNAPGSLPMKEGEGLPELIIRAGGARPEAALTRVSVTREGKIIQVDAFDAVREGKPLDFALQDGDFVVIPQNNDRVLVMEAVARPGYYPIPERGRLTLLDVLAQATPQQNTKTVLITRAKADGTIDTSSAPREFSLEDLRKGKKANFALSPRDIVYVPSPKSKRNVLGTLSSLGALRFLFPF